VLLSLFKSKKTWAFGYLILVFLFGISFFIDFSSAATQYTLSITYINGGLVTLNPKNPGDKYDNGTSVQLFAEAPGWSFTGWSGDLTGSDNPANITMDSDKDITATFTQDEYTLTVNKVGSGSVEQNPDQTTYHYGDEVTLSATPDPGWSFTGWSVNVVEDKVTILEDTQVTATFTQDEYTLTVNKVGSGSVEQNPDQTTYHYGDEVTLSATPDPGWSFTGWSVNVVEDKVTILEDTQVTATFTFSPVMYNLTTSTTGTGAGSIKLNPTGGLYAVGTVVTMTAIPISGSFTGWSGDLTGSDNPATITMDADKDITAKFTRKTGGGGGGGVQNFTLSVSIEGTGSGLIELDPPGDSYVPGTEVSITATPDLGSSFSGWSGDASGSVNIISITMDLDRSINATFTKIMFPLEVKKIGSGSVSKKPDQDSYIFGNSIQLIAVPARNWVFSGWSGDASGNITSLFITMDRAKSVTATFTQLFDITLSSRGVNGTNKNSDYIIFDRSNLTLPQKISKRSGDYLVSFEVSDLYFFVGWEVTGNLTLRNSTANPTNVAIIGNGNITAIYQIKRWSFTFIVKDPRGEPFEDVSVFSILQPSNQPVLNKKTNLNGTGVFLNIIAGRYQFKAEKDGYSTITKDNELQSTKDRIYEFKLSRANATINVLVTDSSGYPLKNVKVSSINEPKGQDHLLNVTDAKGMTQFNQINVGEYNLLALVSGYKTQIVKVSVLQNEDKIQTFILNPLEDTSSSDKNKLSDVTILIIGAVLSTLGAVAIVLYSKGVLKIPFMKTERVIVYDFPCGRYYYYILL
jgi:uncharacterized repeat protein (TIGR02543 family)